MSIRLGFAVAALGMWGIGLALFWTREVPTTVGLKHANSPEAEGRAPLTLPEDLGRNPQPEPASTSHPQDTTQPNGLTQHPIFIGSHPISDMERSTYGNLMPYQIEQVKAIEGRWKALMAELEIKEKELIKSIALEKFSRGEYFDPAEYAYDEQQRWLLLKAEHSTYVQVVSRLGELNFALDDHFHRLAERVCERDQNGQWAAQSWRQIVLDQRQHQFEKLARRQGFQPGDLTVAELVCALQTLEALTPEISNLEDELERIHQTIHDSKTFVVRDSPSSQLIDLGEGKKVLVRPTDYPVIVELQKRGMALAHKMVSEIESYVHASGGYYRVYGENFYRPGYWNGVHVGCDCN